MRTPRVSLCWDDERPPFSFVTISGVAATSADPGELVRWATRIGGRYMGADRAQEFGRRNAVLPELVVRVTPPRIAAKVDIASFGPPVTGRQHRGEMWAARIYALRAAGATLAGLAEQLEWAEGQVGQG